MQIVIDIPEKIYKRIIEMKFFISGEKWKTIIVNEIIVAIRNGTPLPKGHGRLGDLDKLKKDMQYYYDDCAKTSEYTRLGFETAIAVVEDANTIIEADKEETNAT